MLELKNIQVRFRERDRVIEAVRGVSLRVARGEVYGIVGTSGAGKSTLLRTINLLERPSVGEVWIEGREITHLDAEALRAVRLRTGMVFQHFNLAHSRTVHDNIALPLRAAGASEEKIRERVPKLLQLVELSDKQFAFPGQLSGGQKQRVGIARALANEPPLLLCDEPTSALDLETTESILDLLAGINVRLGVTVVIISHEMAVIKKICHRVAVMQNGSLVEENNVYDLFATPQHELSRELVKKSLDLTLPPRVLAKAKGSLVRLVYLGEKAEEPIFSETAHQHGVRINILHGRIEYIDERPIGILIVSLDGEAGLVTQALHYLASKVAKLEVFRHG
jgi:D-methionine transport system ATP-binding protein